MNKDQVVEALGGSPDYENINGVVMWITDMPINKAMKLFEKQLKGLGYESSFGVIQKGKNHGKE